MCLCELSAESDCGCLDMAWAVPKYSRSQVDAAGSLLLTLEEAKTMIEAWRKEYNEERPHSSLNDLTPMEFIQRLQTTKEDQKLQTQLLQ